MRRIIEFSKVFYIPIIILVGIFLYLLLGIGGVPVIGRVILIAVVILGSYGMFLESARALVKKQFALDYIAMLAIIVALVTQEYLVAGILALMISTGTTLEEYGARRAKKSLTQLVERIPTSVTLWEEGKAGKMELVKKIKKGTEILVRRGEVIPLDGILISERGETDESSLTGEPYFIEKMKGDIIRSGTVNTASPMVVRVTREEKDSTYKKIITLVKAAEKEKSPMVRMADKYSTYFTVITLAVSAFAFFYSSGDLSRVLAVLAVATPCPLIIATPIALLGGVNSSAQKKVIVKKLASLEALSRTDTIVFDKTGTITLGKPQVVELLIHDRSYSPLEILGIALSIERNSLHPLAKAIVEYAKEQKAEPIPVLDIREEIGSGISGEYKKKKYILQKGEKDQGMAIDMKVGKRTIAQFFFEDEIKKESKDIIRGLKDSGLQLFIFTGDKKNAAEKVVKDLGSDVIVYSEMSPEDKQKGIKELRREGRMTVMVGDGINDAPALALSDVGIAFSNQEEQTAASEAADMVILGGGFEAVHGVWQTAQRTVRIAKQSIIWGIGLSITAMIFASVGLIPPIVGAGIQEAIDVAVILNALRASR